VRVNHIAVEEAQEAPDVVIGMFFINDTSIVVLFDSRVSHSFIAVAYVGKHNLLLCHTPFRERRNEASIRVPRMFKSHVRPTIW
jgi:hypothetical protein